MNNLSFKIWLEEFDAKSSAAKDMILSFLKGKLHIHNDEDILSMKFSSMDKSIVADLMTRGILKTADTSIMQELKDGNITVQDLIDRISGGQRQILNLPFNGNNKDEF